MPTNYKGYVVPVDADVADAPKAFTDFTDSIPFSDFVEVVEVTSATRTVEDADNGKMLFVKTNSTLTFGTLTDGFSVAVVADTGVTVTFAGVDQEGATTSAYEVATVIAVNGTNVLTLPGADADCPECPECPDVSDLAWGDFTTSGDEQNSGTYTDSAGRDWKWAEWNVADDYSVDLTGGMYWVLTVGGGDGGQSNDPTYENQGQPGLVTEGYWDFATSIAAITVGKKGTGNSGLNAANMGQPSSIGDYGTQGAVGFGNFMMGRGAQTYNDRTGYKSTITGTSLEYAPGNTGPDRPGRPGNRDAATQTDGCVIIATVTNKPGDWYPPGVLPGIGGWSDINSVTGTGNKYEYTADGEDWSVFEWTADGSVTTSGGLADILIVGGGAAASSSFSGGSGGVLHGIQQISGGEQNILVGTTPTGGNNFDGGRSAIGDDSIGGGFVREKGPNGFKDYESGGYGAGAGSTGDAPDADTGGPGFVSSITGTQLEYAQGGGKYLSDPDYEALPAGCGSDRQNNSDVNQYRGTDGAVIIRVPRTSDKTGLSVGSFTVDTLRDKRKVAVKETAQTRRKNKTEDK